MRLLHVDRLELVNFSNDDVPKYATASHRWVSRSETTFKDVLKKRNTDTPGHKKVEAFAKYVREYIHGVEWLWIDTCCINQDSAAELSEAVNLMFEWYRGSEVCIAYLADVGKGEGRFEASEWWSRGWTLQELIAPRTVVFVGKTWDVLGFKGVESAIVTTTGGNLDGEVQKITGIPVMALRDYKRSLGFSVDERLKWMEGRRTTREEDMSYALYGIFGVSPGANYGERQAGARARLLAAISHSQNADQSKDQEVVNPKDPEKRGTILPATLRFMKKGLYEKGAQLGWELVDEFESLNTNFAGGTFMTTYSDDPTTIIYLTVPSSKGDNRADWTILAPNSPYCPGKHSGHLIFRSDFPFSQPAVWWDTPILSPFPRDGHFSGDIVDVWSPSPRALLSVIETMASMILRPPKEVEKCTLPGQFRVHLLPKLLPGSQVHRDLTCAEGEWWRECTQFFCRAFNRVDDDLDGSELDQDGGVPITEHHRAISCQAIESFIEHILVRFCLLEGPFTLDGLGAREFFETIDTMASWVEGEKQWAKMLDEASGWMVSQDRRDRDRNKFYHM